MSCDVGCRCGFDLVLLWLWCRPVAIALIQLLDCELPYAAEFALEKAKEQGIIVLATRSPISETANWIYSRLYE